MSLPKSSDMGTQPGRSHISQIYCTKGHISTRGNSNRMWGSTAGITGAFRDRQARLHGSTLKRERESSKQKKARYDCVCMTTGLWTL